MTTLPITLVLPTRNCYKELLRHRAGMESVLPSVAQVVAADSESSDGTAELLSEWLSDHSSAKILSLPPGLYEAWNSAVQESNQPWIYFSTIGDIVTVDGLAALQKTAQETGADAVISPPIMREADGVTPSSLKWPVHNYAEKFSHLAYRPLSKIETVLVLCSYLPQTFFGSSASNLYRATCLKEKPFPLEYGHAGDVAFGIRYARDLSLVLHPHEVATFTLSWQFKESGASKQRDVFLRLSHEAQKMLAGSQDDSFRFLEAWFASATSSKMVLWDWLASNEGMHQNYHHMIEIVQNLEKQIAQRFPERLWLALQRLIQKFR